ncbi:MAG: hypothetical protein JJU28_01755 [Cyclobacteriaceae bacterium]|nr:hypothetical protein [Cyclobacteriaceae bacterium]
MKKLILKLYYSQTTLGVVAIFVGMIISQYYRPWSFSQQILDFGLASSAPGFFAILATYTIGKRFQNDDPEATLNFVYALYILQEVLSINTNIGTFDVLDLVYYTLGYFFIKHFLIKTQKICHPLQKY